MGPPGPNLTLNWGPQAQYNRNILHANLRGCGWFREDAVVSLGKRLWLR